MMDVLPENLFLLAQDASELKAAREDKVGEVRKRLRRSLKALESLLRHSELPG
jgi:hypothetical protein